MNASVQQCNTATDVWEAPSTEQLLQRIEELEADKAALLADNDEIRRQLAMMRCR